MGTKSLKVTFIGAINYQQAPVCGETAKNQILLEYLEERYSDLHFVDTYKWRKSILVLIKVFIQLLIIRDRVLIISTSTGSAYRVSRILYCAKRKYGIYYFVIGNTIINGVEDAKYKTKYYKQYSKIYVEGRLMLKQLNYHGLNNVEYLPNFKKIDPSFLRKEAMRINNNERIHFVFLSRITADKGVSLIFKAMGMLNYAGYGDKYDVTFFGSVDELYKKFFEGELKHMPNAFSEGYLNLQSKEGYDKLAQFNVMLFPTFWIGEGFPGAIIDAFIAGLPVVASDWSLNSEIIADNITGLIIKERDAQDLADKMKYILDNNKLIVNMSKACIEQASNYDFRRVLSEIEIR